MRSPVIMEAQHIKSRLLVVLLVVCVVLGVKGCSPLEKVGVFARTIYSTSELNLLLIGLEVFEEENYLVPSRFVNGTLDLLTEALTPETEIFFEVTEPPPALEDPSGGYVVTGSWPNYTLAEEGEPEAPSIDIRFSPTNPLDMAYVQHFVSMDTAYVIAALDDAAHIAIVDLSQGVVVNYVDIAGLVLGFQEPLPSSNPPVSVYEDINVVSLLGADNLCQDRVYLYYNETTIESRFTKNTIGARNSLNSLSTSPYNEAPTVFLLSQVNVLPEDDPSTFYVLPGIVTVTEVVLSTGEVVSRVDFTIDESQFGSGDREPTTPPTTSPNGPVDTVQTAPPTASPSGPSNLEPTSNPMGPIGAELTTPPTARPSNLEPTSAPSVFVTTATDSAPSPSTTEEPTESPTASDAFSATATTLSLLCVLMFLTIQ